jgi:hypothetical protein
MVNVLGNPVADPAIAGERLTRFQYLAIFKLLIWKRLTAD